MLFAIGAGPQVAGVSNFTTYPPAAVKLPVVATFASVDAERIVQMHPALVVGIASQEPQVRDLRRAGLNVVLLHDDAFEDIFTQHHELGETQRSCGGSRGAQRAAAREDGRVGARGVPRMRIRPASS